MNKSKERSGYVNELKGQASLWDNDQISGKLMSFRPEKNSLTLGHEF